MKIDVQLGEFDLAKAGAEGKRLESMGFDALWSWETDRNPFLPLAMTALSTQKIQMGTNIAVAFPRTPMVTATMAWDLQRASHGRFMLGLGTQVRMHNKRRLSAPSDSPAPRVREYILCIRAIWDAFQNGAKPNFKGEFYEFTLLTPFFNPGPLEHPHIPIYLAGVKPLMCRVAGEVADGMHVHPFHSVRYLKEVLRPSVNDGAKLQGKSVEDLELFSPVFAVTGDTEAERSEREKATREQLSFYASTPNYRDVLELHGWTAIGEELSKKARAGDWESMGALISDEMLDTFAVSGDFNVVPKLLQERYSGVLDRVSIYYPVPPDADPEKWKRLTDAFHP